MKQKIIFALICFMAVTLYSIDKPVISSSKKEVKIAKHLFNDLENEYILAKTFFSNYERKQYKKLKKDKAKWNYIENFWMLNDPNPITSENELLMVLKNRIDYCNKHYGTFKPGWKSDPGRILIRHGMPDDILKGISNILGKHGQKEYHIWKYRMNNHMTFIFFDLQTHGDFRLIFSENDEKESSYPDWYDYMGEDFDTGILY